MSQPPVAINPQERAAAERLAEALGLPAFEPGWVWLAGAGPGDPGLVTLRTDPLLDPLRNEPRFQAIERQLKFP